MNRTAASPRQEHLSGISLSAPSLVEAFYRRIWNGGDARAQPTGSPHESYFRCTPHCRPSAGLLGWNVRRAGDPFSSSLACDRNARRPVAESSSSSVCPPASSAANTPSKTSRCPTIRCSTCSRSRLYASASWSSSSTSRSSAVVTGCASRDTVMHKATLSVHVPEESP